MATFMLEHSHLPEECPAAFAAWKGFESSLRGQSTLSSCRAGGHRIWWEVDASSEADALSRLPAFVAQRTVVSRVNRVEIP